MTGATKKAAKGDLDSAAQALSKAKSKNHTLQSAKKAVDGIDKKINNIDKHLPGNITNQLEDAKKRLHYASSANKSLLERRQNQGVIKNFMDKESRSAHKQVKGIQKDLSKLEKKKLKAQQETLNNLNVQKDRVMAMKNQIEDSSGISDLKSDLSNMQSIYDKAVRQTRNTRLATVGGIAAGGYGLNKIKNDKESQQSQLQGNYYAPSLNNSF